MSDLFITDTLMRILGTNQIRCLVCYLEFEDDDETHAVHRHFHKRMREIHRLRGLPIWPFKRANLERTFTVSSDKRIPTEWRRAILARNSLTASYYELVYRLLRNSSIPVDDIISFEAFVVQAIDNDPDLADIRNEIMEHIEDHEFTVNHNRRIRRRERALRRNLELSARTAGAAAEPVDDGTVTPSPVVSETITVLDGGYPRAISSR